MLFPILLGVAAIALIGCQREERNTPSPSANPPPANPPPSPTPVAPTPPVLAPAANLDPILSFSAVQCNPQGARPVRFVIHDARAEFCRLHDLLLGQNCQVEGNSIRMGGERSGPSLVRLFSEMRQRGDFSFPMRNAEIQNRLASLEGLQTYLYSGTPCRFDGEGDFVDLIEAYSLYDAARRSPTFASAFQEGRVGCILKRGVLNFAAPHDHHDDLSGVRIHHESPDAHDQIFTPATLRLNPGLAVDTPVSGCLAVR